jgi:hypothetical protein
LAAVALRERRDEQRILERGGVDADLVCPSVDCCCSVRLGSNAATDGERDEQLRRDLTDRRRQRPSSLDRRGDVENHELVDPFDVVACGELRRIAGVAQPFEVDAFDDRPVADIKTRDDAFAEHGWSARGHSTLSVPRDCHC